MKKENKLIQKKKKEEKEKEGEQTNVGVFPCLITYKSTINDSRVLNF